MDIARLQRRLAENGFYARPIDGALGRHSYAALLSFIARTELGDRGLAMGESCVAHMNAAGINTELRLAHFLAQTAADTQGYRELEENLSFTAKQLINAWPKRFATTKSAASFVMNPRALALKVYGDRLGNGPAATGDGWAYRGRGLLRMTGRTAYALRESETGVPLVALPELASDPKMAVRLACLYWTARTINKPADADDMKAVRRAVNGGDSGMTEVKAYLARAKRVLL